ncbi:MAG: hypothetical protein K9J79_00040 [Desulfobacteraceae bacterium]|nr:hypothetical protein [Desulfobacteraceae bacterium]MCF8093728.1 hypothetical protein [Desulfobacteraceae bacterium]
MSRWFEISANRRALAYILFSGVVLGAMFFLGIQPTRQQIAQTEKKTERLKAGIEEQKIFYPLYQRLQKKTAKETDIDGLASRVPKTEAREFTIDNVSAILSEFAARAGIQQSSFSPVPSSMSRGSEKLLVNGRLEGSYPDFRDFLISLVTASDFRALEMMRVQSGTRNPKYRLRIWVTVK